MPPSSRSSSTIIGSPSNSNELFVFGGEYYNGALATFYNDLFIYLIDRDEWRLVTSPNSPLPRSGHAWCRGGNAGGVYLFGGKCFFGRFFSLLPEFGLLQITGEFSSPKQGTFYHYNDFWRLEPSTREWDRLETKGKGPPARSGHRMVAYKVSTSELLYPHAVAYYSTLLRSITDRHGSKPTNVEYRTTSSCLAASKTHLSRPSTYRIYGFTIARIMYGIIRSYLQRPRSLTLDHHSRSYPMNPAP